MNLLYILYCTAAVNQPIRILLSVKLKLCIWQVDGPAAFLDILSPPYGEDIRTGHDRDCHYYQELSPSLAPSLAPSLTSSASPNSTWLLSVPTPAEFWCDQVDYQGPTVTSEPDSRTSQAPSALISLWTFATSATPRPCFPYVTTMRCTQSRN